MEQMCFKPFKRFKIKVRQSLRRDVFYHDFSGCCQTVPVNKDQFFYFLVLAYFSFKICSFTLHPVLAEKKLKNK